MNKKIVIANWKEHYNVAQGSHYMHKLQNKLTDYKDIEVVIAVGFVSLQPLYMQVDNKKIKLAVQNLHWEDEGPATGEVSGPMIRGLAQYVIVGHSYRRAHFNETDQQIVKKVAAALRNDVNPVVCIGENALDKSEGHARNAILSQLEPVLASITTEEVDKIVFTYEPVWAISNNDDSHPPKPTEIKEAIDYIRSIIKDRFGHKRSKEVKVLYGGSVDSDNAKDFALIDGLDGFLVGSASLKVNEFAKIVDNLHTITEHKHNE